MAGKRRPRPSSAPAAASASTSSAASSSALALKHVCTVCPVLRFVRIKGLRDVIKLAHISDTFRDALENYSATVWRRLVSRIQGKSSVGDEDSQSSVTGDEDSQSSIDDEYSLLPPFFKRDAFAWAARNMLTVGQLDVSRMWLSHPICVAAENGAVEVVRVCLAVLPKCVDVRECGGDTVVKVASRAGHVECVRELLDAGADITDADNDDFDQTALHAAADAGHVDVVRLLVEHDGFEEIRDKGNRYGKTPLHLAARYGRTECVRALLAAGASITGSTDDDDDDDDDDFDLDAFMESYANPDYDEDYEKDDGNTVLHYAAEAGNVDMVRMLAAHRDFAKLRDKRNDSGKTAMDLAKTEEIKQILSGSKQKTKTTITTRKRK